MSGILLFVLWETNCVNFFLPATCELVSRAELQSSLSRVFDALSNWVFNPAQPHMSPPIALAAASALPAAAGLPDLLPGEAAPEVLTLHRSVCSPGMSSQEVVSAEQAYVLSAGFKVRSLHQVLHVMVPVDWHYSSKSACRHAEVSTTLKKSLRPVCTTPPLTPTHTYTPTLNHSVKRKTHQRIENMFLAQVNLRACLNARCDTPINL